jgi:hypothetical protein
VPASLLLAAGAAAVLFLLPDLYTTLGKLLQKLLVPASLLLTAGTAAVLFLIPDLWTTTIGKLLESAFLLMDTR